MDAQTNKGDVQHHGAQMTLDVFKQLLLTSSFYGFCRSQSQENTIY